LAGLGISLGSFSRKLYTLSGGIMSIAKVTKRTGRVVPFDRRRIEKAIYAAARAVGNGGGKPWAETISWAVTGILEERFGQNGHPPHVEEIQDVVEEVLIKSGHPQVAKAYILYRQKRAEARATQRMLMDTEKLVDDYLQKLDWRVNENSNMNYSLQGLNFYLASSIAARYWLHKIYPAEVQQAHSDGDMHIHDLGMLSGYTYYGKEVVVFRDAEGIRLTSFEQLYANCPEPAACLNEADGAFAKYPRDSFVLDKDGWTRVVRLVRKHKNKPMRFIKNRGGRSVIVTDDHPMITADGETLAARITPRTDTLYTADMGRLLASETLFSTYEIDLLAELHKAGVTRFGRDKVYFNGVPLADLDVAQAGEGVIHTSTRTIPRRIPLTTELGYFVGFVLAEGYLSYDIDTPRTISVSQKNPGPLHEINRPLIALGIPGCISHPHGSDMYELQVKNVFLRFLFERVFGIQPDARCKSLPVLTLHYSLDFVKGMLAGILDGDGSIASNGTSITVRVSARTLLEQMAYVFHLLGATPRDRNIEGVGTRRTYKGREIVQRFPLYGLSFRKTAELALPSSLFQSAAVSSSAWQDETRDAWHVVLNNEPTDIPDDEIYDITTESGTLIVNGMWNHNCAGWDLQDLLIQGFGGVPAKIESRPPKHLRTALGQLVNFFYTLQGEVAGAVAVSNFDTLLAPFVRYDKLDYTGIKQAVQEFVYNINVPTRVGFQSLVWEELVLVRRNGRIAPIEIGQIVDEQFERNRHRILTQGHDSFAVANADDVQALAFDADGSVRWVPVKAFVRHRVPQGSTFVRIRTSRGTAAVSQAHSMFAFEKLNGRLTIRPVAAHQVDIAHGNAKLTPTNHLVAVRHAPNGGTHSRLDLVELIDDVPQLADRVRVRLPDHAAAMERLKARVQKRFGGLTAFYLAYGIKDKGSWRQWAANRSLPYRVWRDLGADEAGAEFALRNSAPLAPRLSPENQSPGAASTQAKLANANGALWYARALAGDRLLEFLRLLGWYIAEGHHSISNGLYVSQARGGDQDEMVRVLGALGALGRIEEMRGWSAQGNPTQPVLRMAGKGLLAALIGFLGGTHSMNKVIPWFIYDLTHELQEEFIATLLRGDGSEFPDYWDYTTTSKRLSLGLSLLLAMNGYKFSVYETPAKRETWSDQYTLRIHKDKASGAGYAIGDLLGRVCNRREPFAYEREYEYDLSVDTPLENFTGGSGLLCFHNTPFTNITMDLTAPSTLSAQAVIIGGKAQDATYGEFQEEMDQLNRAFAEVMIEGDAHSRAFTFPIPTFNVTRDFDWANPVLEPVWTMTAKYGLPYFCLEENTAVLTKDRQPVPIKQVRAGDHLIGSHREPVAVTAVFHRESPEIVRITLGSGEDILATPTHRFPTSSGLKEAARLSLEDKLIRAQAPAQESIIALRREQGPFAVVDVSVDADDHLFTLANDILSHNSNYINSDMNPEDARSMCLYRDEEVLTREGGHVRRLSIGELVEGSSCVFDTEGWGTPPSTMEALGLNRQTYQVEWIPIRRFLRVQEDRYLEITTEDGKVIRVSPKHILAVLAPDGLQEVLAEDVQVGAYVFSLKQAMQVLPQTYQTVAEFKLDKDLARILGCFTADGNYLFESRKELASSGRPRGLQFTFGTNDPEIAEIKQLLETRLGITIAERQDPRNNTYYLYVYNATLARQLYDAGFRKYGRLPDVLFNSPRSVIEAFLGHFFKGDGYERDQEIHIADMELARDIVLLYSLVGQPTTYRCREQSQVIYLQHQESATRADGQLATPTLAERVPAWMAKSAFAVPGLHKGRMVGIPTLDKYKAQTEESRRIAASDVYVTRITKIEEILLDVPEPFYDIELQREHLFVHSLGTVTHNCCRLRLDNRELRKRAGGLFAAAPLTGSAGVVTINMPRIAYQSHDEADFQRRLEKLMETARTSLEIKRKMLEQLTERGLYPYSRHYLRSVKAQTGGYWSHHFSTIGLIGMNEACLNLIGVGIAHPEGKELAVRTLQFMREVLTRFQLDTGNLYNLEATPAEGASYRLARADKKDFPDIITAGTEQTPYYTNSTHLSVGYSDDLFAVLDHQDDLQTLYTGGTVLHIFLGERLYDWRQARKLVRTVAENYRLPYFTLTPTFSICPVHGYIAGEHKYCPYEHTEEQLARYGREVIGDR
jgi:anaerobic ribonucleoside-triphosphate reductase